MTYLDYVLHLNKQHKLQPLSPGAYILCGLLLDECNYPRWSTEPIEWSNDAILRVTGIRSLNTMKGYRDELVERGLISFQPGGKGRANSGVYAPLFIGEAKPLKVSKSDTLSSRNKVSTKVSNSDTLTPGKVSDKVSTKVSNSDTLLLIVKEDKKIEDNRPSCVREAASLKSSSPELENTCTPAEQKGGATAGPRFEPNEVTKRADESQLADQRLFDIVVADAGYTGLDNQAYRLQMLATARDKKLEMPARSWRNWITGYLNSDKRKDKLLLAPALGTAAAKSGRGLGDIRSKASKTEYTL